MINEWSSDGIKCNSVNLLSFFILFFSLLLYSLKQNGHCLIHLPAAHWNEEVLIPHAWALQYVK